ncbi:MAG: hypothetical protein O3A47_08545 [Chloroflexi bacterium]|nr:hypothetical protein [Chloroflexota bacterium]
MAIPGKSAREMQEEIQRALAARQRSSSRRGRSVRIAAVALAAVILAVFGAQYVDGMAIEAIVEEVAA